MLLAQDSPFAFIVRCGGCKRHTADLHDLCVCFRGVVTKTNTLINFRTSSTEP
jgi:hypothetical protein